MKKNNNPVSIEEAKTRFEDLDSSAAVSMAQAAIWKAHWNNAQTAETPLQLMNLLKNHIRIYDGMPSASGFSFGPDHSVERDNIISFLKYRLKKEFNLEPEAPNALVQLVSLLQPYVGQKIVARDNIYQFSNGAQVNVHEKFIGIVEKVDKDGVHVLNKNNPVGYKRFVLDSHDFKRWVEEGRYHLVVSKGLSVALNKNHTTELLMYDRSFAESCSRLAGLFDIASPQETADLFGKPVKDGNNIYFPLEKPVSLDEQIAAASTVPITAQQISPAKDKIQERD